MFKTLAGAALLAGLAIAPAIAQDAAPKKEKRICKADAKTGSRMATQKICKTAAEWQAESEAAQRTMGRSVGGSASNDETFGAEKAPY